MVEELSLRWKRFIPVQITKNLVLPQFELISIGTENCSQSYITGECGGPREGAPFLNLRPHQLRFCTRFCTQRHNFCAATASTSLKFLFLCSSARSSVRRLFLKKIIIHTAHAQFGSSPAASVPLQDVHSMSTPRRPPVDPEGHGTSAPVSDKRQLASPTFWFWVNFFQVWSLAPPSQPPPPNAPLTWTLDPQDGA